MQPRPLLRILPDRYSIMHPIMGGVCPVGGPGPVGGPVGAPTGEPHLIGASVGLTASLWISGALLRFRSGDGNEYGETGAAQGTPGGPAAIPRSVFVDGSEDLTYVDDSGTHRKVSKTSLGAKPGGAVTRSIRYDAPTSPANRRVQFAGATNHYQWSNGF